jgi:hypothetical protein
VRKIRRALTGAHVDRGGASWAPPRLVNYLLGWPLRSMILTGDQPNRGFALRRARRCESMSVTWP